MRSKASQERHLAAQCASPQNSSNTFYWSINRRNFTFSK